MASNFELKDFLEASTETARRVRYATIIVVVVSVLIFAGLLNSLVNHSWIRQRIKFRQEYNKKIELVIRQINSETFVVPAHCNKNEDDFLDYLESTKDKFYPADDILQAFPPTCGQEARSCLCFPTRDERLQCLRCAQNLSRNLLDSIGKSYVENVHFIKVPFFGVVFDINDLGLIGGISLFLVLLILRLSLRTYIVSLRIIFKASMKADGISKSQKENLYELLATRQLFVFPTLFDKDQKPDYGATELTWKQSGIKKKYDRTLEFFGFLYECICKAHLRSFLGFFLRTKSGWRQMLILLLSIPGTIFFLLLSSYLVKTQSWWVIISPAALIILYLVNFSIKYKADAKSETKKDFWIANPQPWLKRIPKVISIMPTVVYAGVIFNDYRSMSVGTTVDYERAMSGFIFSIVCFICIFAIGCWCISKWYEIDRIWDKFYDATFESGETPVSDQPE